MLVILKDISCGSLVQQLLEKEAYFFASLGVPERKSPRKLAELNLSLRVKAIGLEVVFASTMLIALRENRSNFRKRDMK